MDSQDFKELTQQPRNDGKRYTKIDCNELDRIAKECATPADMRRIVKERNLSERFGRTEGAICKRIETTNGWFFRHPQNDA